MVHRRGLSVLVHPRTGDTVADHDTHPLWMGEALPIDVDFIRHHAGA
jgi:DOPA 4,5-dioxygenase